MIRAHYKIVTLSSIGAGLEFFDFTIYALFAPYISINFFPQFSPTAALINTFAIFAIGYFARPLGGIILGHIGDRYGRKNAFTYAILVMAIATLLIGCLPGYKQLGIAAPLILIGLRLLQGLSLGGELAGAITFTLEHYEGHRKGLMQALISFSMTTCSALASIVGTILNSLFSSAQMIAWGWRLPFMLGFLIGLIGFLLRRRCLETPAFVLAMQEEELHKLPLASLIKKYPHKIIIGFCLTFFAACFTSFLFFTPTYFSMHANFPMSYGFAITASAFVCLGLGCIIAGYLADKLGPKKMLVIGCILFTVLGYAIFYQLNTINMYNAATLPIIFIGVTLLALIGGCFNGTYMLAIAEQFPTNVRYSGIGLCQSLSLALIGGTAPLIFTSTIKMFNSMFSPYYYITLCGLITTVAGILYKPYFHKKS